MLEGKKWRSRREVEGPEGENRTSKGKKEREKLGNPAKTTPGVVPA